MDRVVESTRFLVMHQGNSTTHPYFETRPSSSSSTSKNGDLSLEQYFWVTQPIWYACKKLVLDNQNIFVLKLSKLHWYVFQFCTVLENSENVLFEFCNNFKNDIVLWSQNGKLYFVILKNETFFLIFNHCALLSKRKT